MTTARGRTQGVEAGKSGAPAGLAIGDLAARTGLTPAVLRMWETRYGFPQPQRLESGHRRYAESDVAAVEAILRRREAGVRLEVAVAEAAGRRSRSPPRTARRCTPSSAVGTRTWPTSGCTSPRCSALSWAIEDECLARAERALVFGAFQEPRFYEAARPRWTELARVAEATVALAAFDAPSAPGELPVRVPLDDRAPLRREWAVVCDAPRFTAALTAWEVPGQARCPRRATRLRVHLDRRAGPRPRRGPGVRRRRARRRTRARYAAHWPASRRGWPTRSPAAALLQRVLAYVDRAG